MQKQKRTKAGKIILFLLILTTVSFGMLGCEPSNPDESGCGPVDPEPVDPEPDDPEPDDPEPDDPEPDDPEPDDPGTDSYPDASTTGVPAGTSLTSSGTLTITTPETVIDGYEVDGIIMVKASNVTIRNTRVIGTDFWSILVDDGLTNVRIEDTEVDGQGASGTEGSHGIMGPATILRCNISGVENGITPGGGSVLRDNYIHDLGAPGDPHYDGVQIDGNLSDITIEHNTIILEFPQTSAVMIDNYFGPISNIIVNNNYLAGGAYTVYSDGQFDGGPITGVQFTNNRMEKGEYGYASIENNTVVDRGNVDAITGDPITLQ
jgi:hypothetical protein